MPGNVPTRARKLFQCPEIIRFSAGRMLRASRGVTDQNFQAGDVVAGLRAGNAQIDFELRSA